MRRRIACCASSRDQIASKLESAQYDIEWYIQNYEGGEDWEECEGEDAESNTEQAKTWTNSLEKLLAGGTDAIERRGRGARAHI